MTFRKTDKKPCSINLQDEWTEEQSTQLKSYKRLLSFLQHLVETKDKTSIEEFLEQKSMFNPIELGRILWSAVLQHKVEVASILIKAGADLNVTLPLDYGKASLLHEVVKSQDNRLAMLMIKHGADVNARDKFGTSVIHYAIEEESSVDVIKELLNHGARVDVSLAHPTIMHLYASEVLSLLLQSDSFNAEQRINFTIDALSYLCCRIADASETLHTVKMLLDMKLPIEKIENDGFNLECAIRFNKVQVVQLLIEYGFDVNKPSLGVTLPLFAASGFRQSTITEMLIHAGADVNGIATGPRAIGRRYPLHAACQYESVANIRMLLRHGADVNVTDSKDRTPFSLFDGHMNEAHKEVIKHLAISISKGQKINDCDLEMIERHSQLKDFYLDCLNELQKMKVKKIVNNVSFFSCFDKNVVELAYLTRNCNFLEKYNDAQRKFDFSIYHEEMDLVFQKTVARKESLSDRKDALCESLKMTLPYIPLERIVYYFYFSDF